LDNTNIITLDDVLESCPLLDYLEVQCEDTSRKRVDSVLRRADQSTVEQEQKEDYVIWI
jgi:hypothetical protein